MSSKEFQPNRLTFSEGVERIKKARETVKIFKANGIVTSLDPGASELLTLLQVDNVPQGFTKYQLPVFMENIPGAQFFLSFGSPGHKVAEHSHDEGDGYRFIASGSIIFDGKELKGGDWMFIPKEQPYSFLVGPQGVGMVYCYACCCA
jgi:hypothetical protein